MASRPDTSRPSTSSSCGANTPVTATVDTPAGGRTGMGRITVTAATLESIQVTPGGTTLPRGAGQAFAATGMYSDGSTADVTEQATWSSSDTAVATVGNSPGQRGVAITADAGTTRITAAVGGVTGSTDLDVSDVTLQSIALEPNDVQADRGDTIDFRATGRYSDGSTRDLTDFATWRSTNTRAVVVSDAPGSKGEARALESGDADVEASFAGRTGTAQVRVGG